jgi:hypothetical protein
MRCCRWRAARFETGGVGSGVGAELIQETGYSLGGGFYCALDWPGLLSAMCGGEERARRAAAAAAGVGRDAPRQRRLGHAPAADVGDGGE